MLAPCPLGHDFRPSRGLLGGDSPWIPSRASAPAGFLGHVGCTCRASLRRLKDLAVKMDPGNDAIISIDDAIQGRSGAIYSRDEMNCAPEWRVPPPCWGHGAYTAHGGQKRRYQTLKGMFSPYEENLLSLNRGSRKIFRWQHPRTDPCCIFSHWSWLPPARERLTSETPTSFL
jgi:hypothetical protein